MQRNNNGQFFLPSCRIYLSTRIGNHLGLVPPPPSYKHQFFSHRIEDSRSPK